MAVTIIRSGNVAGLSSAPTQTGTAAASQGVITSQPQPSSPFASRLSNGALSPKIDAAVSHLRSSGASVGGEKLRDYPTAKETAHAVADQILEDQETSEETHGIDPSAGLLVHS